MNRKVRRQTQGNTRRALKTAWQHHKAGRLHEAGKLYRQVLKAEPRNADALGLLGMIALQLGDSEIAADLLCRAVLLQPTNPVAHRYLGDAYLDLHRSADAEACYRSSLALKGDDADVHNRLATALQAQGRLDEAERSYRQALEYGPTLAIQVTRLGKTRFWPRSKARPRQSIELRRPNERFGFAPDINTYRASWLHMLTHQCHCPYQMCPLSGLSYGFA